VIKSCKDRETQVILDGGYSKRLPQNIQRRAFQKLRSLDATTRVEDLQSPPSNHLEALRGDRAGQWSIRINDQWRICFRWEDGDAHDVEIADYH
jgi:proteic killer suppression protein